ncbi:MAG: PEP-CTERM sorting domain-containing protein [Verrucomicrobiota bacterium JB025]|nr:PEP-CTERM sorting domain-containing protein [Verrucomicrobiota bacterium JB025]
MSFLFEALYAIANLGILIFASLNQSPQLNSQMNSRFLFLIGLLSVAPAPHSQGAIFLDFNYDTVLDRTVLTYSGSWDTFTNQLTNDLNTNSVGPSQINAWNGLTATSYSDTQPLGYLPLNMLTATSRTGDSFGFLHAVAFSTATMYAPVGYVAGTNIQGSLIFDGIDLEDLGFTYFAGTNSYGSGTLIGMGAGNDVSWDTRVTSVPEPSTAPLSLLAGISLLFFRKRRG